MIPMSGNSIEQNPSKLEIDQDSFLFQKSPEKRMTSINFQNNSNIKEDIPNNLIDTKKLDIFHKELQMIAKTGNTLYSWEELKPYILYYYEKNVKNLDEKKNGFERLNFSYKKSSNEFGLDFGNRKDSNIRELDLNISNEIENDKHMQMNMNIAEDLNFHMDNNYNIEQNFSFSKSEKSPKEQENITKEIIEYINKIKIMPFTIQRIAELLLEPEKYYSTLPKYNRAFNKLVNIDFY